MSEVTVPCEYSVGSDWGRDPPIKPCGRPAFGGERYCNLHVHLVHKRTDIYGNELPDRPNAPWKQR